MGKTDAERFRCLLDTRRVMPVGQTSEEASAICDEGMDLNNTPQMPSGILAAAHRIVDDALSSPLRRTELKTLRRSLRELKTGIMDVESNRMHRPSTAGEASSEILGGNNDDDGDASAEENTTEHAASSTANRDDGEDATGAATDSDDDKPLILGAVAARLVAKLAKTKMKRERQQASMMVGIASTTETTATAAGPRREAEASPSNAPATIGAMILAAACSRRTIPESGVCPPRVRSTVVDETRRLVEELRRQTAAAERLLATLVAVTDEFRIDNGHPTISDSRNTAVHSSELFGERGKRLKIEDDDGERKEGKNEEESAAAIDLLFQPFEIAVGNVRYLLPQGQRSVPRDPSATVPVSWPRNELDAGRIEAPPWFDPEVVFVQWSNESQKLTEARPPFLGTWNANRILQLGRPDLETATVPERARGAFTVPRVEAVDYEYDSGDDWDSDVDVSCEIVEKRGVADADENSSAEDDIDPEDDDGFVVATHGGEDDEEGDDADEDGINRSEWEEIAALRKRKPSDVYPRFEGVFDGLPLARHPMRRTNHLRFESATAARAMREGTEYQRIARAVFDAAHLDVPEGLQALEEQAMAEARQRRDVQARVLGAQGVVVKRKVRRTTAGGQRREAAATGPAGSSSVLVSAGDD